MTDQLRQAAQQVLDAWDDPMKDLKDLCVAMDTLRTALEQQAEPVPDVLGHIGFQEWWDSVADDYEVNDFKKMRRAWNAAVKYEAAPQQQAKPVAWEHHAKKLTHWLHCMSYNDSYFGEPAGLVKQVTAELNRLIGTALRAAPEQQAEPVAWTSVAETLPKSGVKVLACYRNRLGNLRRIRAMWTAAKTEEADSDDAHEEYDEATDTYYVPEGWYECIDNWGDYSSVAVTEGEVTHWMPLPQPPIEAAHGIKEGT